MKLKTLSYIICLISAIMLALNIYGFVEFLNNIEHYDETMYLYILHLSEAVFLLFLLIFFFSFAKRIK